MVKTILTDLFNEKPVMKIHGFKFKILFYRQGYTPHFCEHFIDPIDGREKLLLAIPHTNKKNQHKVVIYDPKKDEIEWEVKLEDIGEPFIVHNPHMAHVVGAESNIIPLEVWEGFNIRGINAEPGDIICPSINNTWIVIDRDKKYVKLRLKQSDVKWAHDIIPSKDGRNLIIGDYYGWYYRKVSPSGSIVWNVGGIGSPGKFYVIPDSDSGHQASFGGDYLVAINGSPHGVREIRDRDGKTVWRLTGGFPRINSAWLNKPHSAFRSGLVEFGGAFTVVGFEQGGGIVAYDKNCRPVWGFMRPENNMHGQHYKPTSRFLAETTHVFPTLKGTIGCVDWGFPRGSAVLELLEIPNGPVYFMLAWDHDPGDNGTWYDPPIDVAEWNSVTIFFINQGANSLDYEIYATKINPMYGGDFPKCWKKIETNSVAGHDIAEVEIDTDKYSAIRIFGKRTTAGSPSNWKIVIMFK